MPIERFTIVEKHSGDWLVVVAQNTNWIAGPNPELIGIKPPIVLPTVEGVHALHGYEG